VTVRKPYAQRLTDLDNWLLLPANTELLKAAGGGKVDLHKVLLVLTRCVIAVNDTSGTFDLTYQQIAERTLLPPKQVQRALTALTNAGVLVTVTGSRSGGAAGAAGRAPVRRIAFLSPVDIAGMAGQLDRMAGQLDPIGGTVNPEWQDSQLSSPSVIPSVNPSVFPSEGENFAQSENQPELPQTLKQQVLSKVTDRLVAQAVSNGVQIKFPEGFKQTQHSKALKAWNKAEQWLGEGLCLLIPQHPDHYFLLDWCAAVASEQNPSPTTYQQLEAACKKSKAEGFYTDTEPF